MRSILMLIILALCLPLGAQADGDLGDLMVIPTRVVLEGRERSAEVILRNAGPVPSSYRIFFQEMRMLPSGEVEEVAKTGGALYASDLVRFSPRQVDLGPNESQTVRIQVRKPEGLKDGEYHSHLVFQRIPPAEPAKPLEDAGDENVSINIQTLVSICIPVIVRHGDTHATVSLSGLAFQPATKPEEAPALDLLLNRSGNRGVMGEFKVDWIPRSGRATTLDSEEGRAVYPEVDAVNVRLELPDAAGKTLKDGRFKVTFNPKDIKQPPVIAFLDLP